MTLRLATAAPAPPPPSAEAFDAARLRQDAAPASPLLRRLLYILCALVAAVATWVHAGRLDIVAVADGRLVPAHAPQDRAAGGRRCRARDTRRPKARR